jgi:hypothetical protein
VYKVPHVFEVALLALHKLSSEFIRKFLRILYIEKNRENREGWKRKDEPPRTETSQGQK